MSDSALNRRQPPSPLVFSPEAALAPVSSTSSSSNVYSANTVSMPFVRRHVTRRLKTAKADCDKELQRVTNSITAYFEEKLKENELEREFERDQREREREQRTYHDRELERGRYRELSTASPDTTGDAFFLNSAELRSALQSDDTTSDGGYEFEHDRRSRHSRQPSIASRHTANNESSSPVPIRRQQPVATESISRKHSGVGSPPVSTLSTHQSLAARRLSRTIHIPARPQTSAGPSSRSTSRSRSPLPPPTRTNSYSDVHAEQRDRSAHSPSAARRSSRILVDDPVDPIMLALYDVIALCTDVLEISVAQLTANPKACAAHVQRVQAIGKAWDDHPDWHGRNWYVQVLLAVASLSRVVEWYEAEQQFWNFEDAREGEPDEPLQFVTKFAEDEDKVTSPSGSLEHDGDIGSLTVGALRLTAEDEGRLRLSRPPSHGRRSREEPKDLNASLTEKKEEMSRSSKSFDTAESARVLATERLRLQAETAQSRNIVVELGLDGEHLMWINYAWRNVVGSEPEELLGSRISHLLDPKDWNVFKDATMKLQEDDSHTVEVKFRLQIQPEDENRPPYFQLMEGKGMLMIDREDGHPSHTMWVIKPGGPPDERDLKSPPVELESGEVGDEPLEDVGNRSFHHRSSLDPVTPFPFSQPINTQPILCRICECNVPQWYFEKHNETCSEVHRLEADIAECNETLAELRSTIRELYAYTERNSPTNTPEYRGMPIFSPSSSPPTPSPLALFRGPLSNKIAKMGVKKMQRRTLDQLDDILQVAYEIAIPALRDEEAKEPIERQTLLSPSSERKMTQVRNWFKPPAEDAGLKQLLDDCERVMRQKTDNVIRMRNTIKYSEKVRQEWEDRVLKTLSSMDEDSDREEDFTDEEEEEEEPTPAAVDVPLEAVELGANDDTSSTKSEYAYNPDEQTAQPTPLASVSPTPLPTVGPSRNSPDQSPVIAPRPTPAAVPLSRQGVASLHNTRSSTPSSISSPLALVPPIVASPSPPPPMDLNDGDGLNNSTLTLRTQRSTPNLQPKLLLTPPVSPMPSPKDQTAKPSRRRQSTAAQTILSPTVSNAPLSPRLPSSVPLSRTTPTSIKDFDIIKPISKGAFGSVFLARKKATGDYFAIKVLRKADMIAKNQVTNVKAERMILMTQAESPFVAKLYWTFQSKENLYLVMEYLNGGDCAALVKTLGSLPEEWARQYVAEVVLGLESMHQRGIVHRDLKPDNLLIDQHGHLKLTDFGLSRIGLLGRQTRDALMAEKSVRAQVRLSPGSRPPSMDLAHLSSPPSYSELLSGGSYFNQRIAPLPRMGSSPYLSSTDDADGIGWDSAAGMSRAPKPNESPLASFATELTTDLRSHAGGTPPGDRRFVGTPDYLAPETILGLRGDDAAVDWWALGVITYEFLYGMPPFHDETAEKVFENILAGHIEWHEDLIEYSDDARDFMQRLMTLDPAARLGTHGADEVKSHPWFAGLEWDKVAATEAAFIPQVTDPESTDYFDPRGAIPQLFHDEDMVALRTPGDSPAISPDPSLNSTTVPVPMLTDQVPTPEDGFGSFNFKNLPVLKQANDDVIKKLRTDQMTPISHALSEPPSSHHTRKRSISQRLKKPPNVNTSFEGKNLPTNPPSPATSTSSIASSPSRASIPPSTPGGGNHGRKPSEYGAVERFKFNYIEGESIRRPNSMPSRLRTASVSTSNSGDGSGSSDCNQSSATTHFEVHTPPSSVGSLDFRPEVKRPKPVDLRKKPDPTDKAVTCMLAEDNPITAKILETLLIRLGCRCVVVADGSEAISTAMGDIKFDVILMDLHMPVLDGESAARYIKNTNSKNTNTPIVAVSAYSGNEPVEGNSLFAAAIAKPVQKTDLLAVMRQIGFKTSSAPGNKPNAAGAKVTAVR